MKTIKFRGRRLNADKDFVYGAFYLCPHTQGTPNDKGDALDYYDVPFIVDEEENCIWVYPDSIALFLGYDSSGEEIYSDDKICVLDPDRYLFDGIGIENAEDFFRISDIGKTFDNVKLFKESEENDVH